MNRNKSNTRVIHALFGKSSDGANRLPAVAPAIVIVHELSRVEVELPRIAEPLRTRRKRPVVAARAGAVEVGIIAAAGSRKEDTL